MKMGISWSPIMYVVEDSVAFIKMLLKTILQLRQRAYRV